MKKLPDLKKKEYVQLHKYIKTIANEKVYYSLILKGSQSENMYGLAKNHKDNCTFRLVLSAINTPEYNICKWLVSQL